MGTVRADARETAGRDGSVLRPVLEGQDQVPRRADRQVREDAEGSGEAESSGESRPARWRNRFRWATWRQQCRWSRRQQSGRTGRPGREVAGGDREAAEADARADEPGGARKAGPVP